MTRSVRLSAARLRALTLARQFPRIRGRGRAQLLDLVDRIGPLQSQVPRAPFLTAASRLPGIDYAVVRDALADHDLVKASNLRGTVHTSTRQQFAALDVVSRPVRRRGLANHLKLDHDQADALVEALERFATDDWRERPTVVEHARGWLRGHGATRAADALGSTLTDGLVWGHSGLIRRPRDDRWEKRTDVWHRAARSLPALSDVAVFDVDTAVRELVRVHLRAFGPAADTDIAWWLGLPLTPVRSAIAALGGELRTLLGPDDRELIDVVDPPRPVDDPPREVGTRLLAEFDSLLLGYEARSRTRFIDDDEIAKVWAKANGIFSPVVLHEGRLVATWKTTPVKGNRGITGNRTVITVVPFGRGSGLTEEALAGPVADVARVLQLEVADLRLVESSERD